MAKKDRVFVHDCDIGRTVVFNLDLGVYKNSSDMDRFLLAIDIKIPGRPNESQNVYQCWWDDGCILLDPSLVRDGDVIYFTKKRGEKIVFASNYTKTRVEQDESTFSHLGIAISDIPPRSEGWRQNVLLISLVLLVVALIVPSIFQQSGKLDFSSGIPASLGWSFGLIGMSGTVLLIYKWRHLFRVN